MCHRCHYYNIDNELCYNLSYAMVIDQRLIYSLNCHLTNSSDDMIL